VLCPDQTCRGKHHRHHPPPSPTAITHRPRRAPMELTVTWKVSTSPRETVRRANRHLAGPPPATRRRISLQAKAPVGVGIGVGNNHIAPSARP